MCTLLQFVILILFSGLTLGLLLLDSLLVKDDSVNRYREINSLIVINFSVYSNLSLNVSEEIQD